MVVLFLGPSGCGKGTQAELLAKDFGGVPVIAMGDAIRWAYRQKTPEGVAAVEKYANKGQLVPNELTWSILNSYLGQFDLSGGVVFDSFPRTSSQVSLFDNLLKDIDEELVAVIHLETSLDTALARMRHRAELDKKATGKARADESEEAVRSRFEFYRKDVVPLLDIYKRRGLLVNIDNSGSIEEVRELILKGLREKGVVLPV